MESSPQIDATKNGDQSDADVSERKDLISTLPRRTFWVKSGQNIRQYQGFWFYEHFIPGIMSVQERFRAKPSDIIVASPPKTGTTWLKALTFTIATRNRFGDLSSPLLTKVPHDCFPFLEFDLVEGKDYTRDLEIPLIGTHLPSTSLPKSIVQENCKIIFIWRDAKDTFVSSWLYGLHNFKSFGIDSDKIVSLEEAFEMFCQGVSLYTPYWDHVLGYWNAKLENPDKILFLKYEELMKDTAFYVKNLAEFMSYPFTVEEEEKGALQNVVEKCSFDKLSNLEVNKSGVYHAANLFEVENKAFFRKAKVGDWSNYLTPEMGARLDIIMENKLKDSGLLM